MREHSAWITYLSTVAVAVGVFGLAMVVTNHVSHDLFNWMIFGHRGAPQGFTDEAVDYVRFSHGVLGAVMVGWSLLMLWVIRGPLALGVEGAWRALAGSILVWFVIDSALSVLLGYWQNAVLNLMVFGAFVPGLWATRARTVA